MNEFSDLRQYILKFNNPALQCLHGDISGACQHLQQHKTDLVKRLYLFIYLFFSQERTSSTYIAKLPIMFGSYVDSYWS